MPAWYIWGSISPWVLIGYLLILNTVVALFNILMRHISNKYVKGE